jgi:hypothetical protein
MEQWADYLISAVRYEENLNSKVISHFKIHRDNGDSVGEGLTWTMEEVLDAVQRGDKFLTIFKVNRGKWKKGKSVLITNPNALFVDPDSKKIMNDDLITIPEF